MGVITHRDIFWGGHPRIIFNLPPEAVYREITDYTSQMQYVSILDDAK